MIYDLKLGLKRQLRAVLSFNKNCEGYCELLRYRMSTWGDINENKLDLQSIWSSPDFQR